MKGVKPQFILSQETYSDEAHSSVDFLHKAMANPDNSWLSEVVTHMNYSSAEFGKQNFPMLMLTEGMGNVRKVKDFDYKYPIIGRTKKSSRVAKTIAQPGDKLGVGKQIVEIPFEDKWFANQQTLVGKVGGTTYQVRVQGEPQERDGAFWFPCQLWASSNTAFIPSALLTKDAVWAGSVFKVGYEDSYGVESRKYLGGTATNMTSLVRHSYRLKGNVQNKVMRYKIKADGQTFEYLVDWEMFLADLAFKEQCEYDLWKGKYGRDTNGEFIMVDAKTGVGIPSGAGIDEQIPNTDNHTVLTYKRLSSMIRDITFNVSGATPNIEVWTGTGGMEDINNALKDELKGFALIDSKQYSSGANSHDMIYGSYFKAFRHQDGAIVTFRQHEMFDKGIEGEISEIHPFSGLPKSSHDLYILDRSTYDGVNNFQYIMEEGREEIKWSVNGAIIPKGFSKSDSRAHDRDRSEVHGMKSQGIQIMKPTGCLKSTNI